MLSSSKKLTQRTNLRLKPRHLLGVAIMTLALQGAVSAFDNGVKQTNTLKGTYLAQASAGQTPDDEQTPRQRLRSQFAGAADDGTGQDPMSRRARLRKLMQNGGMGGGGDLVPGMQPGAGGEQLDPQLMERRRELRKRFLERQGMGMGMNGMGMRQGMGQRARFGGGAQLFGRRPLDLTPLNLTEDQKEKIKQVRGQTSMKAKEIRRVMMAKQGEMRDMMFDPIASDDAIRAKRLELRKLRDQIEEMTINDFLSIRSVLTPEQRKRLPEIKPGVGMGGGRQGPRFSAAPPGGGFNVPVPPPEMDPVGEP